MNSIILAAGMSSRMGEDKAFLLFNNQPIIQLLLDKLVKYSSTVVLVGGKNYDNLKKFLQTYQDRSKVKLVFNNHYEKGMFSSIKKGVENLPDDNPFFLQMIDQPFVEEIIYKELRKFYDPLYFVMQPHAELNGIFRSGHPILINYSFAEIILSHEDEHNLRDVIRDFPKKRKFMLVKNTTIFDNLNTRQEFLKKIKGMDDGDTNN